MNLPPELTDPLLKAVADIVNTVLVPGLLAAAGYGLWMLRTWLKMKKAEMQAKIDAITNADVRAELSDALSRLDQTAETVIADLEATIKKYSAEGKVLDPEKLRAHAYGRIKARVPERTMELLYSTYGEKNLERLISSKIEQKALNLKLRRAAVGLLQPKKAGTG